MKLIYHDSYNIRLGPLGLLHRFDGTKFEKVFEAVRGTPGIESSEPEAPVDPATAAEFFDDLMRRCVRRREHIFRAFEVPVVPFVPYGLLDRRVLLPMRWGVAGTIAATAEALRGTPCTWNLSGGYHHASPHSMEGFCIYNDIGIAYQESLKLGTMDERARILIIDVDAHHGNGNARTFYENPNVHILDVYNEDLYPASPSTRRRVNFPVPLRSGTSGAEYLRRYAAALEQVGSDYCVAYVVAGTDVLASDPLGQLQLSETDVASREQLTFRALRERGVPAVFLCGGGYSSASAPAIAAGLHAVARREAQ